MFGTCRKLNKQGLVLLEVLIGCALSILILYGLFQFYNMSNHFFETAIYFRKGLHDVQLVHDMLTVDIGKAGYIGCEKLTSQTDISNETEIPFSINQRLYGRNNEITIIHAGEANDSIISENRNRTELTVSGDVMFGLKDILLISDCEKIELAEVLKVQRKDYIQTITFKYPLKNNFHAGSEVSMFQVDHYYIRPSLITKNAYTLYLKTLNGESDVVLDGLSYLSFQYSLNTSTGLKDFFADNISDWSKVLGVSVKFKLSNPIVASQWEEYAAI